MSMDSSVSAALADFSSSSRKLFKKNNCYSLRKGTNLRTHFPKKAKIPFFFFFFLQVALCTHTLQKPARTAARISFAASKELAGSLLKLLSRGKADHSRESFTLDKLSDSAMNKATCTKNSPHY